MKKNILLCVTAGIAIYKICELIRQLKKKGYEIKVVMTDKATKLLTPLLLQELSDNKVYIDTFSDEHYPAHISLSDWANLVVVAPCSCNTISKLATGKTEDLLTATIYAVDMKNTRVLICPSMNTNMWMHPITQRNIKILKEIGYDILMPQKGKLLCNREGLGRLPDLEKIIERIEFLLKK
ncbi:MAG: hypothetical protein N2643_05795 [Endomicrobia bacterium]|nr:hypothetical protein [Endomicrobiia bacterium]